jgi:hypothetical protein
MQLLPPASTRAARGAALLHAHRVRPAPRTRLGAGLRLLLAACGGDTPSLGAGASLVVRDSLVAGDRVPVRVIESAASVVDERAAPFAADSAPELVIGTDEGEPPHELHRVFDTMQWPDGRVVIANRSSERWVTPRWSCGTDNPSCSGTIDKGAWCRSPAGHGVAAVP